MKDGLMTISYKDFDAMDGKWVDDLGIIARIIQQYQESQQSQSNKGATLGGTTIGTQR